MFMVRSGKPVHRPLGTQHTYSIKCMQGLDMRYAVQNGNQLKFDKRGISKKNNVFTGYLMRGLSAVLRLDLNNRFSAFCKK